MRSMSHRSVSASRHWVEAEGRPRSGDRSLLLSRYPLDVVEVESHHIAGPLQPSFPAREDDRRCVLGCCVRGFGAPIACHRGSGAAVAGPQPALVPWHLTSKGGPRLCRGGSSSLTFTAVVHR